MSSSSQGASAPAALAYHLPAPYAADSFQVIGSSEQSGGNQGSGGTGGSSPGTGTGSGGSVAQSDSAKAVQFTATCGATDFVGKVVRTNGSANAVTGLTSADPYPAVGVIVAKSSQTQCTVQSFGLCIGAYDSLRQNTRYFVGPSGNIVPAATAFNVGGYIQQVGFAVSPTVLFVQPRGEVIQLAATRDADGNDTTPSPSADGTKLLYGGILTGTAAPTPDQGRRGDEFLEYSPDGNILLWGPKSDEEGWGAAGRSLVGAAGNRIYVRDTDPDGSVMPNAGDVWINRNSATLFDAA